jgi:hypothetical protein
MNACGYTHSVFDYEWVLQEGLNGYQARINAKYAGDRPVICGALREVPETLCAYVRPCNELFQAVQDLRF